MNAADRAGLRAAVTTEQRTASGALPTFRRTIPSMPATPYEVRIRDALKTAITSEHTSMVASRPPRTPANLIPPAEIDRIAKRAKGVTDAVFGRYKTGPALAYGLNILDQFDVRDAEIAASPAAADAAAAWRVEKILDGDDDLKKIDEEHGAVQSRSAEAALIAPIRAAVIAARRTAHPLDHPIPPPARYSEWENAERAVGVVGIRNAMAAFFLGRTDLIRMT